SLYSLKNVLPHDAPLDYAIFATGAGILDWHTKELIFSHDLDAEEVRKVCATLEEFEIDYILDNQVQDTHHMQYRAKTGMTDFWRRVDHYKDFAEELDPNNIDQVMAATQFLAMVAQDREDLYHEIYKRLYPLSAVRTTSPIDYCTMWIEIFAPGVNKGGAVRFMMRKLGASADDIMVIGNDYNDLEMLSISPNAYVTGNAPLDLRRKYQTVPSCDTNGFAEAVRRWLHQQDHEANLKGRPAPPNTP
ncbi:MAG: HAD family hydrolase, partial [Candidatus Cloacimonetes bacterium]|nr:HAD family hydrolase [Candidatus Cloacimonadota bacterium]